MMTYCTVDKKQVKDFAEVFTPAGLAFQMLMPNFNDGLRDVDKTILDPAVGEGQFLCAALVLKHFFNVERIDEDLSLHALKSLYGIDIQPASVAKARAHLLLTLCDSFKYFTGKNFTRLDEAWAIVAGNICVGDSLEIMAEWVNPQQSLF